MLTYIRNLLLHLKTIKNKIAKNVGIITSLKISSNTISCGGHTVRGINLYILLADVFMNKNKTNIPV